MLRRNLPTMRKLCIGLLSASLLATGFCATAQSGALSILAGQADLTPEKLIRCFSQFTFELSAQPQDAETFLQRQRGDCDDFAILASRLLTQRGYTTRLVAVMMAHQTHVVCYVQEARGFLDFNHRAEAHPVRASDGSLEDVAQKVARDFRVPWLTASEFRWENKRPVYLDLVFASAPSSKSETAALPLAAPFRSRETNHVSAVAGVTPPALFGSEPMEPAENLDRFWTGRP